MVFLGDIFEVENVIILIFVVLGGGFKFSLLSFSVLVKDKRIKDESEVVKFDVFVKFNLNVIFKIGEEKFVDIIGFDILDWREEVLDGEE